MIPSLARLSLNIPPPSTGVLGNYDDRDPKELPNKEEERIRLIAMLASGELELRHAPEELQNDRDAVLAAVAKNGHALFFASEELQNDRDVVLTTVAQDGTMLSSTHPKFRNDREVVLAAVAEDGKALSSASDRLQDDRGVVLVAVAKDGMALFYASTRLRNDREVVLAAVEHEGMALFYASGAIRGDRDVVLIAVAKDGFALIYASDMLKNDREVVLAAVTQNGEALKYALMKFRNDREVVLTAVAQNGMALNDVWDTLENDPEVMLAAVAAEESPMFYLIPTLHEPLSDHILAALASASRALKAFENGTGTKEAVVAECNHIRDIEQGIENAMRRMMNASEGERREEEFPKKQEYLDILEGLNVYLGNYSNNPCVRLVAKEYPQPAQKYVVSEPNKRQRIEAALATALLRGTKTAAAAMALGVPIDLPL